MKTIRFAAKRALHAVLVLFCVSVLALSLVKCTPGDFFDNARVNPSISPSALASLRADQGLDKSIPVLYWRWLCSVWRGEWGVSFAYNTGALSILLPGAVNTLKLAVTGTAIAWIFSLVFGIFSGLRPRGAIALLSDAAASLFLAVPEIVLALAMLFVSARIPGLRGTLSVQSDHSEVKLLVPATCLAVGLVPMLIAHLRSAIQQSSEMPFVRAARSLGISRQRLFRFWIWPASSNAIISLGGASIGVLMSSSLVIEGVFGWPGLGLLTLQAINDRDIFLVVDSAIFAAGFFVIGNSLADVLLYLADPRIRDS